MEQFFKCGSCWIQVCREAGLGQGKAREDRMTSTTVCSCHKKDMIKQISSGKEQLDITLKKLNPECFPLLRKKKSFCFSNFPAC